MLKESSWNTFKVFIAICVVALIVVSVRLLYTEQAENSILKGMTDMRHMGCSGTSGCSSKCPHVKENDPRVAIDEYVDSIRRLTEQSESAKDSFNSMLSEFQSKLPKDTTKKEFESTTSAFVPLVTGRRNDLQNILQKGASFSGKYATSSTVTPLVMTAFNYTMALEAAAAVRYQMMSLDMSNVCMKLSYAHLRDLDERDQHVIKNYQMVFNVCAERKGKVADMQAKYGTNDSLAALLMMNVDETTKLDQVMSYTASFVSKFHEMKDDVAAAEGYAREAFVALSPSLKKDSFSNDLPGRAGTNEINNLISEGDYTSALIKTALEPEIVLNHKKHAEERATFDSGGGVPSVRDDDRDLIKWVGVFGRPTYRRSDGSSADKSSEPLRQIPSDNPEDLMRTHVPRLTFN